MNSEKFTRKDLKIFDDAPKIIKQNANKYMRSSRSDFGKELAEKMVSVLLWTNHHNIHISNIQNWWSVSSDKDWIGQFPSAKYLFEHLIPMGGLRQNEHRPEILIFVFSECVIITKGDNAEYIKGDATCSDHKAPNELIRHAEVRRIIFRV